jgi:Uma2 family endonuclease
MPSTQTRIGPADHGRRMTLEEFREVDEEPGYLYELARGVVEVTEVPNDPHGQIEDNLREALAAYRRAHPGMIRRCGGASAFRLWIPEMISGRNPDQAFVLEGTPKDARGRRPPSWAAEIVSAGNDARERDYVTKREEYLTFGLREYWIIDPELRQVTVLVRMDGPDWSERTFKGLETIESRLLPGFQGKVSELWIDAELEDE